MTRYAVKPNPSGRGFDVVEKSTGRVAMAAIATRTEANGWRDFYNAR